MEMLSSWWGGEGTEKKDVENLKSKDDGATQNESSTTSTVEKPVDGVDAVHDEQTNIKTEPTEQQDTDESTEAAIQTAKEWGSYLYNFAKESTIKVAEQATKTASAIQKTVEDRTIVGAFNKEQEKFLKEKHSKRSEAAVPPWVGYNEEEIMKEQIMALSQDKRNFLRNPPAGVQFHFDFQHMFPIAMATLQEDDRLQKMRFDLVPKQVIEENFWRNYFYRVSLIKQSSQLTSLANKTSEGLNSKTDSDGKKSTEESKADNRPDKSMPVSIAATSQSTSKTGESEDLNLTDLPPDSPPATEFVSDAFNSELDQEDLQKGMEQLGMDKKDAKEDADAHLRWFIVVLLQTLCFLAPLFRYTGQQPPPSNYKMPPFPPSNVSPVADESSEVEVPKWEMELQQELQDYEVVDEDGEGNEEWEKEIDQMLEDEVQEESK